MNPAVFLDRDGTMLHDVGYLDRFERMKLFPYVIDSIRLLNRAGFKVVVVTSQNGIARGVITEKFVNDAHAEIGRMVAEAGGRIDGFYYCPHDRNADVKEYRVECDCKKPKPGMILTAARELSIDLGASYVIGDRWRDIEMGHAAGVAGILVETGYGKTEAQNRPANISPVPVVATLIDATSLILCR